RSPRAPAARPPPRARGHVPAHRARHAADHGDLRPHRRLGRGAGARGGLPRRGPGQRRGRRGLPGTQHRPRGGAGLMTTSRNGRGAVDLLLDIQGLRASYGAVEVLRGIDFTVAKGEIVALLGTNGAGKSTILRCISGLLPPDAGHVYFEGRDIAGVSTEDTVRLGITQIPGGRGLLPNLSVEENL